MSTGLQTTETWMQQYNGSEYQVNIPTTGTPRLHVCQDKSPEVKKTKIASIGDLVVRPTGTNLGQAFNAVVLSADRRWFRWGDEKKGDAKALWGKVLWDAKTQDLTAEQAKDTVWGTAKVEGGKNIPPKASDTIRFLVLPVEGEGEKMVLNPQNTGAIVVTMDRTSLRAGDTLASQLKAIKAPSFVSVIRFTTTSDPTKNDVQVWTPSHVGYVPQKHGKTLADAASVASRLWDTMGAGEAVDGAPATHAAADPRDTEDPPF